MGVVPPFVGTSHLDSNAVVRGGKVRVGQPAGCPPIAAALASSVLFGLAHLYQGWFGCCSPPRSGWR